MSDFDATAVLAGSVRAVTAQLADFTVEQLNELHDLEEKRDGGKRTSLLTALHTAIKAKAPPPPAPPAPATDSAPVEEGPREGVLVLEALPDGWPLADILAYHEAATVVLADEGDVPIAGWPPLEFGADAFEAVEGGTRLRETIDMGIELPPSQVKAFWLTIGGVPTAVARLAVPLPAGGGRRAQMPSGSLRFRTDG